MKKTMALLLILVFGLAMLPAFASEYAEPIEITWMIPTQQSISLGESEPTKKLLEKFNITVSWIELAPNDQHPEKLGLLLAAQELPDIITWVGHTDAVKYGIEGAYLEITPYLDSHFPNLKKVLEDNASSKYAVYTTDGKLWYVPTWSVTSAPNWGWSINKAAFEEVGYALDDINSFADFKKALKALKEAYPDCYPLTARGAEVPTKDFISSFLIPFTKGMVDFGMTGFDYNTNEYKLAVEIDGYKEAFMYMNELYEEGLLNPEFLTLSMDDITMQLAESKAFALVDYVGGLSGHNLTQETVGNVLYPITWPSPDDEPSIMGSKNVPLTARGTVFPADIVDDEEKFARVAAMIDYMYTDEYYDMFYNNPAIIDPEGNGQKYVDCFYTGEDNMRDIYMPWSTLSSFQHDPIRYDVKPGTAWADFCIAWNNEYADRLVDPVIVPVDTELQEELDELNTLVDDYWTANSVQFIIGQTDFSEWDNFVAELNRVGGAELVEKLNDNYSNVMG